MEHKISLTNQLHVPSIFPKTQPYEVSVKKGKLYRRQANLSTDYP